MDTQNKNKPKYLTLYTSENGKISAQSYTLSIEDSKTKEKKDIEMIRINKKTNKFVEWYGYQDINSYMDMSAKAFKEMIQGIIYPSVAKE